MKLDSIATLATAAECRSLSEAALRLRVSRPVVGERIVELGNESGCSLLKRTTRKLTYRRVAISFNRFRRA